MISLWAPRTLSIVFFSETFSVYFDTAAPHLAADGGRKKKLHRPINTTQVVIFVRLKVQMLTFIIIAFAQVTRYPPPTTLLSDQFLCKTFMKANFTILVLLYT